MFLKFVPSIVLKPHLVLSLSALPWPMIGCYLQSWCAAVHGNRGTGNGVASLRTVNPGGWASSWPEVLLYNQKGEDVAHEKVLRVEGK